MTIRCPHGYDWEDSCDLCIIAYKLSSVCSHGVAGHGNCHICVRDATYTRKELHDLHRVLIDLEMTEIRLRKQTISAAKRAQQYTLHCLELVGTQWEASLRLSQMRQQELYAKTFALRDKWLRAHDNMITMQNLLDVKYDD